MISVDLSALAALADRAVDAVVPTLVEGLARSDLVTGTKSSSTDLVTEMDRWSESTIVEVVHRERPGDGFVGEEGASIAGDSGCVWLVDPIDGTTNYVYGLWGCTVSVAVRVDDVTSVGVVHDLILDERFRAIRGRGATRNGESISASSSTQLHTSLIATGFGYDPERRRRQAKALVEVLPAVRDVRRCGGAALDLCSVACGRVDGYFERGLNPWDHAAGALIAREAGAVVTGDDSDAAIVVAGPGLHGQLADLVTRSGAHEC